MGKDAFLSNIGQYETYEWKRMVKGFIALTLDMDFYTLFVFYLIPKQGNNDADIIF